jgi:hypothetical protein
MAAMNNPFFFGYSVAVACPHNADPPALAVVHHIQFMNGRDVANRYAVVRLQRLPGATFDEQAAAIAAMMRQRPLRGMPQELQTDDNGRVTGATQSCQPASLIIDITADAPLADLVDKRTVVRPERVTIVPGAEDNQPMIRQYRIGTRNLLSVVQAKVKSGELKFPGELPDAPAALAEIKRLLAVGWEGIETYDVMVTAIALALWRAAKPRPLSAVSGMTYRTALTKKRSER